ncbi:MAG: Rrf2 family transcriptional regulator [Flavobacteriaceae bacterium]
MLSRKTKYGLKALSYLAKRENNEPIQIEVISKAENISLKFLESILLTLKKAGFLGAKKGKGGGYYLLEKTRNTPIAAFYRVLEGPIALVPCVSLNFYETCEDCPDEDYCSVHNLMIKVRDNTLSILENTTLSDFVTNQTL